MKNKKSFEPIWLRQLFNKRPLNNYQCANTKIILTIWACGLVVVGGRKFSVLLWSKPFPSSFSFGFGPSRTKDKLEMTKI
jgi:hypothetical protein